MKKLSITILAITMAIPALAFANAPMRQGTATVGQVTSDSNPWTIAYTVPPARDRCLVVIVGANANTSVTWNGYTLTKVVTLTAAQQAGGHMFYLNNPQAGAFNVVINFSEVRSGGYSIATYQDCAQENPVATTTKNNISGFAVNAPIINSVADNTITIGWAVLGSSATNISTNAKTNALGNAVNACCVGIASADVNIWYAGSTTLGFGWDNSAGTDIYLATLKGSSKRGGRIIIE